MERSATTLDTNHLCSLSRWSEQHIKRVFESSTDAESLRAIKSTFAENLSATLNGTPLRRDDIINVVLAMRRSSKKGLKVHWHRMAEVPRDASCRVSFVSPLANVFRADGQIFQDGEFAGFYVLSGLQKQLPGSSKFAEFERHKSVSVRWVLGPPMCASLLLTLYPRGQN